MSCLQAATPTEPQFGGATAPAKALSEMAVRLVTGLAAGATASIFRAAVAELPPVLKQRLQVIVAAGCLPRGPKCSPYKRLETML